MRASLKRNIWVFVLGVATTLVAMIIFQFLLPLFQQDAELRADIYPHQFVVPADLVEDHAKTTVRDIVDLAKERSELTVEAWTDLQEKIDEYSKVYTPWLDIDGVVFIEISNDGDVPAREVKVTVDGLRFYSLDTREGRDVTIAEDEVIKLPEVSQGHTISVVAWTSEGHFYDSWYSAPEKFGLAYAQGRGDVSVYLPVRPLFSFLDANIEYIAWSLLMIILIIYWMVTSISRNSGGPNPAGENMTEETHEQKD